MGSGLLLVKAHLDSFMAGRHADFHRQLAPAFRYRFLPPVLGEGAAQARRWRDITFALYRNWRYEIEDACDNGTDVVVRATFRADGPGEPDLAEYYENTAIFQFMIEDGLLTACSALSLDVDEQRNAPPRWFGGRR